MALQFALMDLQASLPAGGRSGRCVHLQSLRVPSPLQQPDQQVPVPAADIQEPAPRRRIAEEHDIGLSPPFLFDSPHPDGVFEQLEEGFVDLQQQEAQRVRFPVLLCGIIGVRVINAVGLPEFLLAGHRVQPDQSAVRIRAALERPFTRRAAMGVGEARIERVAFGAADIAARRRLRGHEVWGRGGVFRQLRHIHAPCGKSVKHSGLHIMSQAAMKH